MPDFDYTMENFRMTCPSVSPRTTASVLMHFCSRTLLMYAAKTLLVTLAPAVVLFRCCGFGTDLRLLKKHTAWIFRSLQSNSLPLLCKTQDLVSR